MVMNRVLGEGSAARLFRNIREDKGYNYGVYSNFSAQKYLNHFGASSSVRTEVTGPALEEFLNEFRAIREIPVPREPATHRRRRCREDNRGAGQVRPARKYDAEGNRMN